MYDKLGGVNDPGAEQEAVDYVHTMMDSVRHFYEIKFNNFSAADTTYEVRIISIDIITDDYPFYKDGKYVTWNNFGSFWQSRYPCAAGIPDIIHVISGHRPGEIISPLNISFYGWSSGGFLSDGTIFARPRSISLHGLVGGSLSQDTTYNIELALHEFGHNFGMIHDESLTCHDCTQAPSLMCAVENSTLTISNCNFNKMVITMTSTVVISNISTKSEAVPSGATCTNCKVSIQGLSDKTAVAFGCPDAETLLFRAEVGNDCDTAERLIRISFLSRAFEVAPGGEGPFTVENNGTTTTLLIKQNGQEAPVLFGPEEKKIFSCTLKIKHPDTIDNSFGIAKITSTALNTGGGTLASASFEIPYAKFLGSGPNSIIDDDGVPFITALRVNGILKIDGLFSNGAIQNLFLMPGSKIEITPGADAHFTGMTLVGCSSMWRGIEVKPNSKLTVTNSCIADAQHGIRITRGNTTAPASVEVKMVMFSDNNFGVTVDPTGPEQQSPVALTYLGNQTGFSGSLKPAYSGQSPTPGTVPYAGMWLNNLSLSIDGANDGLLSAGNHFSKLRFGILAENTNLLVRYSEFMDMQPGVRPANYPGPWYTGTGIHGSGGQLSVQGGALPVTFTNAYAGIETSGASVDIRQCNMEAVRNGIVARGGFQNGYHIAWNEIEAIDRGIGLFYQSGLPGNSTVEYNTIVMSGNPQATGIYAGGTESFPHAEGLLLNNQIDLLDGAAGIQLGVAHRLRATGNTVTLSGAGQFGLRLEGGLQNTLNCNDVSGAGQTGIYAIHADRAVLLCNTTAGAATGLHFEGMLGGRRKADVAGNTMEDHQTGMRYGVSAITGSQQHRGNTWPDAYNDPGSFGAKHEGGIAVAFFSNYIVDDQENDHFLPNGLNGVEPAGWFVDVNGSSFSYYCTPGQSCPLEPVVEPESRLDTLTARGELSGGPYAALNNWLGQRRLYARFQEEGNIYPGVPAVELFLDSAYVNGLHDFYLAEQALRAVFALDSVDAAALRALEQENVQLLDSLRILEGQLHAYGLTPQDSVAISVARNSVRSALEQTDASRSALLAQLQSGRDTAAVEAAAQIALLPVDSVYQQYDKAVSDIMVRSIGSGAHVFSAADVDSLGVIATACPLAFGDAVLRARALLALIDTVPVYYDDESLCNVQQRNVALLTPAPATADWVSVRPNPASEVLFITLLAPDRQGVNFQLLNSTGVPLRSLVLSDGYGQYMLDVSALPPGIYWYRVMSAEVMVQVGKVVISK